MDLYTSEFLTIFRIAQAMYLMKWVMKAENMCQKSEINVIFIALLREERTLNNNINKMFIKQNHLIDHLLCIYRTV